MSKTIKKAPWLLLIFIFVLALFPLTAFAGSSGVSVSSGSVKVGQTFTATLSFNGGGVNVAGVTASVSYDASVIQFVSASGDGSANVGGGGGKVVLETSSTSRGSLSIKLTFKALKAGSSSIGVSGVDMMGWEDNQISAGGSSKSVTVTAASSEPTKSAKPTKSPKPSTSPSQSPSPSVDKNLENAQNGLKQLVDGKELMVWRDLSTVKGPEGFTASNYEMEGEMVQAFRKENSPLILLYLTDATGQNGGFYVYSEASKGITQYLIISSPGKEYINVAPGTDVTIPQGYIQTTKKIGEVEVVAWGKEEGNQDFFLFYALNAESVPSFYMYDVLEGTIQRFDESTLVVVPEPEPEPTETTIPEPVEEDKGLFARLMDDDGILAVVGAMAGLVIILLVIILAMVISNGKKKKLAAISSSVDTHDAGYDYEVNDATDPDEKANEPEEKSNPSEDDNNL